MTEPHHVPQHLRESAEFAHARIDALQAAMATYYATFTRDVGYWMEAFQNLDRELASKWPDVGPAIRERES